MGAVDATRGTENERTRRVKHLMCNTGTRMLMIDEFQHFFDKGTKLIMHHVADWLKILVDETRCVLVIAGLPSCQTVIDSNEQLAGRFHAPILMPRFSWQDVEEREEFIGILQAFQQVLSQHFQTPEFQREAMAFRFYGATGANWISDEDLAAIGMARGCGGEMQVPCFLCRTRLRSGADFENAEMVKGNFEVISQDITNVSTDDGRQSNWGAPITYLLRVPMQPRIRPFRASRA